MTIEMNMSDFSSIILMRQNFPNRGIRPHERTDVNLFSPKSLSSLYHKINTMIRPTYNNEIKKIIINEPVEVIAGLQCYPSKTYQTGRLVKYNSFFL